MAETADKAKTDKLAPHRKIVADAIDSLSNFTDSAGSPETTAMRVALMHMGRAHTALKPTPPSTPDPYIY